MTSWFVLIPRSGITPWVLYDLKVSHALRSHYVFLSTMVSMTSEYFMTSRITSNTKMFTILQGHDLKGFYDYNDLAEIV